MSEIKLIERTRNPLLSMEVVNKSSLAVVSRTDYTTAASTIKNKICFTLYPSIGNYENAHSIKLRFRQSNVSTASATVYESNSDYSNKTWNRPLDYIVEDGVVYREVDLTTAFNGNYQTKYFSIMTSGVTLYTSDASTGFKPELIVKVIPEYDLIKHQVSIDGSIKDDQYSVDVRTGKMRYDRALIDVKTPLSMISLGMSYNLSYKSSKTLSTGINTGLGKGFKFNYQQYVYKSGTDYIYLDSSYLKHTFKPAENVTGAGNQLYYDSLGTYLVLEETSSNVIIQNDNTKLYFNSTGLLTSIVTIVSSTVTYTETIEYNSDNTINKISNGTYYITISYSTSNNSITLSTNDGRTVVINLNSSGYMTSIVDECNNSTTYEYYNTSTLNKIQFGNDNVLFTYTGSYKVEYVYTKYGSNIVDKKKLNYLGDRTKVETSKYPTDTVDNLKITNVFVFDDRGFNIVTYEEEDGKIGSLTQYEINDEKNRVINLNSGVEYYHNTITFNNSTKDEEISNFTFNSLLKGKYILSFGYKINRIGVNNLANPTEALIGTLSVNGQVLEVINFEFPQEEYRFINKEIELENTGEDGTVKLVFNNLNLGNYSVTISGITLSSKPIDESVHVTDLEGVAYFICMNGVNYYLDSIPLIRYSESVGFRNLIMDFTDIAKTQKSLNQDTVKMLWYNNGKGLIYNVSEVEVSNGDTSFNIISLKNALALKETVFEEVNADWTDEILITGKYVLQEVYYDSSKTYVKSISYTHPSSSPTQTTTLEIYDKYGYLLSKEQNSTDDNSKKNLLINTYDSNGLLKQAQVEQNGIVMKEVYGYDIMGNQNYHFDQKNAYSFVNNIMGKSTSVIRNGTIISNNEYDTDLVSLKRTYLNVGSTEYENNLEKNQDLMLDRVSNNSLVYDYDFDDFGRLSCVKFNELNGNVEVTKMQISYNYVVYPSMYEVIVTYNSGEKVKHQYDRYNRLIAYYESDENGVFILMHRNNFETKDGCAFGSAKLKSKELFVVDYKEIYEYNILGNLKSIVNQHYDITVTYKDSNQRITDEEESLYYNQREIAFANENVTIIESSGTSITEDNTLKQTKSTEWKNDSNQYLSYESDVYNIIEYDGVKRKSKEYILFNDVILETNYEYLPSNSSSSISTKYLQKETFGSNKSSIISSIEYGYTNNLITSKMKNGSIEYYTFDQLDRIKTYTKGNTVKNYSYDINGNIYIAGKNCVYNGQRLTSFDGKSISYDSNGNMSSFGSEILTFEKNRLISYNYGTNVTFGYDYEGKRVSKSTPLETSLYFYDGTRLVREHIIQSGFNEFKDIYYTYGVQGLIGFIYQNKQYLYRRNIFGDIEEIYDENGLLVGSYSYDPFGNHEVIVDVDGIASLNPIRYRGYYYDFETMLFYCNSRYYSPELCRFISPDSIEYLDPQSINGLNLYCYCMNNPIMYADPSGHMPEWLGNLLTGIGIIIGTAFFVAAIVASAGTVGALVGVGAAAIGLSTTAVSTAITVATISTYVVAGGVALFGASDAVEAFSGGINPIRDYVMGGNQTAYNITSGIFNTLGTVAVIAGMVGPKILQKIAQRGGVPKISNGKTVGYSMDFFDKKGNWSLRIDATTHGNPKYHYNPHIHYIERDVKQGGISKAVKYFWEIIKGWF